MRRFPAWYRFTWRNLISGRKGRFIDALKQYYFVGGMPEAVQCFAEDKDFNEVREIQKRILAAYEQDFSQHAPIEIVPKIRMLWNSIPYQFAKENKKFIYGLVQRTLLDGNDLFQEFKGALTEQYVCQQLKTCENLGIYYYTNDRGSCEVDFVVDTGIQVVPGEVKAEVNLRAKSLKMYYEKFSPEISIRTSMADYIMLGAYSETSLAGIGNGGSGSRCLLSECGSIVQMRSGISAV